MIYPPIPQFHKISAIEFIFPFYLAAWQYVQNHCIRHYMIEKINAHDWKMTILPTTR
jgi:hypothetical protein